MGTSAPTPPTPDRSVPPEDIKAAEGPGREVDILAVHRQAFREPHDPAEGGERGPWWFWACAVVALVFGGFYMGRYSGVFTGEDAVHAPVGPGQMMASRGAATPAVAAPVDGATVFAGTCAACHQVNGLGTPGLFPPLAGSEYVTGDAARLVRLVLNGLGGPVTVRGMTFNGAMPPWKQLSDAELAAVLSYVRASWGNGAGAVTAGDVAGERSATATRASPWTIAELR
jgi:mono/diheme cytochrome c family protein